MGIRELTFVEAGKVEFREKPTPAIQGGARFITGRVHARRELPAAMALAASGAFDLAAVATTAVPWERAAEAWMEPALKLVLRR